MNQESNIKNTPQPPECRYEFDPFADLRTIPTGWDLSEMFRKNEDQPVSRRASLIDPDLQERTGPEVPAMGWGIDF